MNRRALVIALIIAIAGDVKQYSDGSPGIVDVRLTPDGSKFVLVGQRAGSTSLLLIRTHSERRQTDGIPGLSWIPVLGVLFGALSNSSEDVEGAVFILPSVVESVPKAQY